MSIFNFTLHVHVHPFLLQNYDIRDRARFLRQMILPGEKGAGALAKHAKKIFLATKPAPVLESEFKGLPMFCLDYYLIINKLIS